MSLVQFYATYVVFSLKVWFLKFEGGRGMAQMGVCQPSKLQALSSNPSYLEFEGGTLCIQNIYNIIIMKSLKYNKNVL
jgi:hypothetical protein